MKVLLEIGKSLAGMHQRCVGSAEHRAATGRRHGLMSVGAIAASAEAECSMSDKEVPSCLRALNFSTQLTTSKRRVMHLLDDICMRHAHTSPCVNLRVAKVLGNRARQAYILHLPTCLVFIAAMT